MSTSNKAVLGQLENSARGQSTGQELYYNPRNGRFEVMSDAAGQSNPDVVVAPYNDGGFFRA